MNKIDFVAFLSVTGANPNGDPLAGNMPRMDRNGCGEMSAECIKRKIRNRMQDEGHKIVVVSNDRAQDGYSSIQARAEAEVGQAKSDDVTYAGRLCEKYMDVRAFGGTFAWKAPKGDKGKGVSIAVRGPVSFWTTKSVDPVIIEDIQITKSTNGTESEKGARGSDTMGMRHIVEFGLYRVQGSISAQLANKTGFSDDHAEVVKECLQTLFQNDVSSARPDGTMEVVKLFWFEHDCPGGQYSSAEVFRSVHAAKKDGVWSPSSVDDYDIYCDALPGLKVEEIKGM